MAEHRTGDSTPPTTGDLDGAGDASESLIGSRVGPYLITDSLGRGGMGEVFLGTDVRWCRSRPGQAGDQDRVNRPACTVLNKPIRLAPFGPDEVLVSDIFNHAIRAVSKDGRVRTIVGAPDRKGHEDGRASTARLASPHGVASTADGRILVAEADGQTLRLVTPRADAPGTYDVSTLAGTP